MAKRKTKAKVPALREESPEVLTGPRRASLPVPDSVILDICDFAHPRDVLHLSRTCKTLHAVLTSRASASAWRQAFRNVEMPDLPDDLAGHRYAALAFEAICDNCYKRCNKRRNTYWAVRLRLCSKCLTKALIPLPVTLCGLPKAQVAQIVPTSTMAGDSSGKTSPAALRAVTSEVQSVVGDPVALAAYLHTAEGRITAMRVHADAVENWDERFVLLAQEAEALQTRREEICARLMREGWACQLERTLRFIVEHPLVAQPRKLFDDDWAETKATLIADATAWYTARQSKKRNNLQKIHRYRRWVMASWISNTMKVEADDDGVWPDPNDLRTMPELQSILNGEFEAEADDQREEHPLQSPNDGPAVTKEPSHPGEDEDSMSSEDDLRDDDDLCDSDDDLLPAYDELSVNESFLALSETVSDPVCADLDEEAEGPLAQQRHRWTHHRRACEDCAWCASQKRNVRRAMELRLTAAIVAWRRRIAAEVFALVPVRLLEDAGIDSDSLDDNDKEAFLSRATIVFCCSTNHELNWDYLVCGADSDKSRLASFPYVLHHREVCIIEDRWGKIQEDPDESYVDPREQLFVAWSAEHLSFDEEAHELAVNLVTLCGLDPSVATHANMEGVDGRFVCRVCALSKRPATSIKIQDWWRCIANEDEKNHPKDHEPKWVRIGAAAEAVVRGLAPRPSPEQTTRYLCARCVGREYATSKLDDVLRHLETHDVERRQDDNELEGDDQREGGDLVECNDFTEGDELTEGDNLTEGDDLTEGDCLASESEAERDYNDPPVGDDVNRGRSCRIRKLGPRDRVPAVVSLDSLNLTAAALLR